jgi:DNA-binding transcriptional regulator/RsmH inhibitor MraZ
MLRGNSETKVDEKGRLKIPAAFKKVFDEAFPGEQVLRHVLRGQERPSLSPPRMDQSGGEIQELI